MLETAMEWYEQPSECCPTQLLLLKGIRGLAAKKRTVHCNSKKLVIIFHNKGKLRHFAPILLFIQARFPHVMIFNIRTVSGFIHCMVRIRLSEQLRIRTVSGPNGFG
ncbi:uncharacterized protein TNCV_1407211 [Trichonephila clavipes]|nr:uncharacterized protein TNCV_1407211 [Trichonephila clavipes]